MKITREVIEAVAALVLFLLIVIPAAAQPLSPEALVKQVAADVLDATRAKALAAAEKREALAHAEDRVLAHIDFTEATRLAAASAWKQANARQQLQLVSAFRAMLVRTYSDTLDTYRGQTMRVLPVRTTLRLNQAVVQSEYVQPGGEVVGVEYAMRRTGGEWKIYDIAIAGMSLVLTYRPVFDEVTRVEGVEGLVRRMKENARARPALTT